MLTPTMPPQPRRTPTTVPTKGAILAQEVQNCIPPEPALEEPSGYLRLRIPALYLLMPPSGGRLS